MTFSVQVANLALSHFGQSANISDPAEQSSEAEHCRRFFPLALGEMLEAHNWTFARARATLAQLDTDRNDFAFKYALPVDCVTPRRLLPDGYTGDQGDGAAFEAEGRYLYANEPNATLVYTKRLTDPSKYSREFMAALSLKLAAYLAGPIVKDASGRTQALLERRAEAQLGEAKVSDGNSERRHAAHQSTAARVR